MRYLIIAILALAGCGREPLKMDPAFAEYVTQFKQASSSKGDYDGGLIQFGDTSAADDGKYRAVGTCRHTSDGWIIMINAKYWYAPRGPDQNRSVLFHELTHCVLNVRLHNLDPNNYMNARAVFLPEGILDGQVADYADRF